MAENIDWVMKMKRELIRFYAEKKKRQLLALKFFDGDFHVLSDKIRTGGKFHEVLTIDARLMVENITSHVRPSDFSVHFNPLGSTIKAKEQADALEDLVNAMLYRWGMMKSLNPFIDGIKNIAITGETGFRTLYDVDAWTKEPEKMPNEDDEEFEYCHALWAAQRATRLPIRVNAIDPLNALPCPGSAFPDFMIEFFKVKPYLLKKDFPNWINTQSKDDFTNIELTTYFDKDTWMYIVNNAMQQGDTGMNLRPSDKNPFGINPYIWAWSGLGKESPEGKPESKAVGLIYPLIPLIKEKSRSLTAVSIILQATAIPRGLTRNAPGGTLNLGLAPGDVTEVGDTVIEWIKDMPIPSGFYEIMSIASQQMERFLGEKILSGQRPTGVNSALFEEILLEQAHEKYRTFIESMEAAYAAVIGQALFLVEHHVTGSIPGTKIKPKDIRGYYQPEITFQYQDIATKRIKAMVARMLFMSGLIDFETAHGKEFINSSDITKIRKGLIKDKMYQDPNLIAAIAMQTAEELGLARLMEQAQKRLSEGRRIEVGAAGNRLAAEEEEKLTQMLGSPEEEKPLRMPESTGGGFGIGMGMEE